VPDAAVLVQVRAPSWVSYHAPPEENPSRGVANRMSRTVSGPDGAPSGAASNAFGAARPTQLWPPSALRAIDAVQGAGWEQGAKPSA